MEQNSFNLKTRLTFLSDWIKSFENAQLHRTLISDSELEQIEYSDKIRTRTFRYYISAIFFVQAKNSIRKA